MNLYTLRSLFFLHFLAAIMGNALQAQPERFELAPIDTTYHHNVHTVILNDTFMPNSFPHWELNSKSIMYLTFDVLEGTPKLLNCSFYHFNQNWEQSQLLPSEYFLGINSLEIRNFVTSRYTIMPYVHYQLNVEVEKFLVSGNYALVVYDNESNVFFTKRFYIAENNINALVKFTNPRNIEKQRTHQSLDLTISTIEKNIQVRRNEMIVSVMQNGNPTTMKSLYEPQWVNGDVFYYNQFDSLLFRAGKEFRQKDISTVESRTFDIAYWERENSKYHAWFKPDVSREFKPYFTEEDVNGSYVVYNKHDKHQPHEALEYVVAHFSLTVSEPLEYPVYIFGHLSDWQLKPEFEMEYDPSRKAYFGEAILKMGFYNHVYAVKTENGADMSLLEGDWYETENDYNIIVYHRPIGSRYDRILFTGLFNSNE